MRTSPSIVPRDDDQNVYLVQDNFGGRLGRSLASPDDTDFEAIIRDLLDGQYSNPSDSTLQMAGRDVSEDVVFELRRRCDLQNARRPLGALALLDLLAET